MSRSKKALKNTFSAWIFELVTAICSFILPRLILSHFGSAYNGITSSITQFIGVISLMQSGIGGVTRAALYKPLAEKDSNRISEIVNATSAFMKKVALLFSLSIIIFAMVYPLLVSNDFEYMFSFTLVIILSISTFAQYFFGVTYQMVLKADQKTYLISYVNIFTTVTNTIVASVLILCGCGIHIVKLGSAIVFIIPPIFYNIYVKKAYSINTQIKPNSNVLSQRWDAFGHQVANFINTNTDIMVITVLLGVKEVSVYTVYYMIGNAIKKFVVSLGSGISAAFGNMLANKENEILKKRFSQFELLVFFSSTVLLTITAVLITPFVILYTSGVNDINYSRYALGYLICISIYAACIKIPYEEMIYAAGEFKKTRNGAFIEAILNIVLSIVLVVIIGLNGVIIGTIIALLYRAIRYQNYISKNIIIRNSSQFLLKLAFSAMVFTICVVSFNILLPFVKIVSIFQWIIAAFITSIIVIVVAIFIAFILFKREFKDMMGSVMRILVKKQRSINR